MNTVRLAVPSDYSSIADWDEFWGDRRQEMQRAELYVCVNDHCEVIGYVSLSRGTFMHYPFISSICVKQDYRMSGVGQELLEKIDSVVEGARHFTSTEPDNIGAERLFKSVGFCFVGQLMHVNFDRSAENFYVREKSECA